MTADAAAQAVVEPAEQIRSWLPDHTHISQPALFDVSGAVTWTWTTTRGVWMVTSYRQLFARSVFVLKGPDANVTFAAPDVETSLRRMHGVLVALDAIGVSS